MKAPRDGFLVALTIALLVVTSVVIYEQNERVNLRQVTLDVRLALIEQRVEFLYQVGVSSPFARLEERVGLAEEKADVLSSEIEVLHCKADLLVSISRVGWWNRRLLDGLRACSIAGGMTNE